MSREEQTPESTIDPRRLNVDDGDMRATITNESSRRVIKIILDRCYLEMSPWSASAGIHYNVGRQDIGREIKKTIEEACPDLWLLMENERMYDLVQLMESEKKQNAKEE